MLLHLLSLIALLGFGVSGQNDGVSYQMTEFMHDGNENQFLYPMMTTSFADGSIAVYHYSVGGVDGQAGLSIISSTGGPVTSITNILPSTNNVSPPGNFVNDPLTAYYPYPANHMRTLVENGVELIELIIPSQSDIPGGTLAVWYPMVIDKQGRFVRNFTAESVPAPTFFYQSTSIPVKKGAALGTIDIGGTGFSVNRSVDLVNFWQFTSGCRTIAADLAVDPSNRIVALVDDSAQAYPMVNQRILLIDPVSGALLTVVETGIWYDSNQLVTYGPSQVSVGTDGSIVVPAPPQYYSRAIYRFTPVSSAPRPVLTAGQVASVWFTGFGAIQGQAVLSDGAVALSVASTTGWPASTQRIVITQNNQIISQFSTITGVTNDAIALGASANLADYLVIAVFADSSDRLYMSINYKDGWSMGIAPSVLIVTRAGAFVDFYTGFQLPQQVFIDRNGYLAVPDRWAETITLIDLTSRAIVQTISVAAPLGGAIDPVNGGYALTLSNPQMGNAAISFYTDNWEPNPNKADISFSFYGYSDQGALSNPVFDSNGHIYVLVNSMGGAARATGTLYVYDAATEQFILSADFANPQPRGVPGVAQSSYASSLAIDPSTRAIVVATVDYGQLFRTVPL